MIIVVRLSKFAEITKVDNDIAHKKLLLFLVRAQVPIKSKHPLLFNISTIVIVEIRNKTISAALPTYLRNILWAINCFTVVAEDVPPARKSKYAS